MEPINLSDVVASTATLINLVSPVDDELRSQPSLLPNWSSGHVLAHIALNAEAFVRVAVSRREGHLGVMYPHGSDGRNADIAELASMPAEAILDRLRASAVAFEDAWSQPVPEGPCAPAPGGPEFSSSTVLLRRLREVVAHGVDIGHDLMTPSDWSDRYVEADLPLQWEAVSSRLPEGTGVAITDELNDSWTAGAGEAKPIAASRRETLAWVLDRGTIAGLPSLSSWG
ncbi:MAG: maleylpyruvate isomerase family mycothiol-dependent enzyme [Acidimicrobiia bacterium]|nr:maleylpyruvate isomerase family mycothiol-dependent enzyme [Acidimicrobiia bacterium]